MDKLSLLSDRELLDGTLQLVIAERACTSDLIEHLIEVDRRKLYLDEACASLASYCIERLKFSEDEAAKRVRVARVAGRFPGALDGLRSGALHLSGLYLLAPYITPENHAALLAEASGLSKRALEVLLARRFPKPDAPELLRPVAVQGTLEVACPGATESHAGATESHAGATESHAGATESHAGKSASPSNSSRAASVARMTPQSASSWAVKFTATTEFAQKIARMLDLLSHSIPSRSLAVFFERALDALIDKETKRRFGTAKPRKRRASATGSRHVPVHIARLVWLRDGDRCAFVDERGRRCTETQFLTIEHRQPFSVGGPPSVENLCVYCSAHNAFTAEQRFGATYIATKRAARQEGTTGSRAAGSSRTAKRASRSDRQERVSEKVESGGKAVVAPSPRPSPSATLAAAEVGSTPAAADDGSLSAVQGALRTLGFEESEIVGVTLSLGSMHVVGGREALLRVALGMLGPAT